MYENRTHFSRRNYHARTRNNRARMHDIPGRATNKKLLATNNKRGTGAYIQYMQKTIEGVTLKNTVRTVWKCKV